MRLHPKPYFRAARRLWYVQLDGKQINLGHDEADAFRRYHELVCGKTNPISRNELPTTSETLVGLIEHFLAWTQKNKAPGTYEYYVCILTSFAKTLPRTFAAMQIKPFHIYDWVDAHPKWSPGMKRKAITAVQRVFNWAWKQGRIDVTPLRHVEKPPAGRRELILTEGQFEHILSLTKVPQFRDLIIVAWETGCRPQEITRVEARHVDLVNSRWVFPPEEAKGKRHHRVIYLTPRALEITKRLMEKHPTGKLFRNTHGKHWRHHAQACYFARIQIALGRKELKRLNLKVPLRDIKELAADLRHRGKDIRKGKPVTDGELRGIARMRLTNELAKMHARKYCLYTLRHSWATRALEKGMDAATVAILMGHTDTRMLMRVYQHLTQKPAHLLAAVNRMAG